MQDISGAAINDLTHPDSNSAPPWMLEVLCIEYYIRTLCRGSIDHSPAWMLYRDSASRVDRFAPPELGLGGLRLRQGGAATVAAGFLNLRRAASVRRR